MPQTASHKRLGFLVHDVSRMRRTFFDQALKPLGVTRSQWWALVNISRHPDTGVIQSDLARILDIGKVAVGGLLDRLEAAGIVYRHTDADDRRVKRVYITEKGFNILAQVMTVADRIDDLLHAEIGDDDVALATRVLTQMKHNLREVLRDPSIATAVTRSVREGARRARA